MVREGKRNGSLKERVNGEIGHGSYIFNPHPMFGLRKRLKVGMLEPPFGRWVWEWDGSFTLLKYPWTI